MAQHFLLSSDSKTFQLKQIAKLSEEEAFHILKVARWGNPNEIKNVCCPYCHIQHHAYFIKSRQKWRCKHCTREFSITTNTAFAFHKLPLTDILLAIALFANSVKGISASAMSRHLNVHYQTAYVLCQKIRETLFQTRDLSILRGEIHEDGCWINFKVRKKNFRKEQAIAKKQGNFPKFRKTKRCVINFSQRAVNDERIKQGANKTLIAMDFTENANIILAMNHRFVEPNSTIMTDDNEAYKDLALHYNHYSVNHSEAYDKCGVNNNLAESFNARFRDLHRGVHHKCDNKYALIYANEAGYRMDNRRLSNGEQFQDILTRCLWIEPLRQWVGYWQGNHREKEIIGMEAFTDAEISKSYFKSLKEFQESANQEQFDIFKLIA